MSGHMWVSLQYTPLEIEEDGDVLHTFTNETSEELARDDAKLICFICHADLTMKSYHEVCNG